MKKLLLIGSLLGAGFAPWLIFSAIDRIGSLPPYDHVADVGKVAAINATGVIAWTGPAGISGAALGTGSSTSGDLASFLGTSGKQLTDSGVLAANVVQVSRAVLAGTGLSVTNSGLLSADITMSANYGVGSTNATVGNDARLPGTTWSTSGEPLNASFLVSVASNAMTIALKQADNTDPTSSTNKNVVIPFRNISAASANVVTSVVSGATGLTVPSGATIGMASATTGYLYVYALRASATQVSIGISASAFDEGTLQSATAVTGTSTSATTLYAVTGYTSTPIRMLGRLQAVETTAGQWASVPFEAAPPSFGNAWFVQTTKGDLQSWSVNGPLRVAVGTTGQTLQSDPTVAAGVSWTTDVLGVNTNSSAASGYRGEWCGATRSHASQLSLTTNTATNIIASGCTLTAGDWEVRGAVNFSATNASTSITDFNIGISATSGALPSANTIGAPTSGEYRARWGIQPAFVPGSSNNDDFTITVPPYRVTVANGATTTLYLIGFATFTVSTVGANGWFEARRIR